MRHGPSSVEIRDPRTLGVSTIKVVGVDEVSPENAKFREKNLGGSFDTLYVSSTTISLKNLLFWF